MRWDQRTACSFRRAGGTSSAVGFVTWCAMEVATFLSRLGDVGGVVLEPECVLSSFN